MLYLLLGCLLFVVLFYAASLGWRWWQQTRSRRRDKHAAAAAAFLNARGIASASSGADRVETLSSCSNSRDSDAGGAVLSSKVGSPRSQEAERTPAWPRHTRTRLARCTR